MWKKLTNSSSSTYFSSPLVTFSATPSLSALLARHVFGVAAEQNVGAAARHVGGDGDGALAAGLRDDLGFLRVVLRVEHDVLRALLLEHARDTLGLFDRDRADQHRAALFGGLDDVVDDRRPLLFLGAIDEVGFLDADHRRLVGMAITSRL